MWFINKKNLISPLSTGNFCKLTWVTGSRAPDVFRWPTLPQTFPTEPCPASAPSVVTINSRNWRLPPQVSVCAQICTGDKTLKFKARVGKDAWCDAYEYAMLWIAQGQSTRIVDNAVDGKLNSHKSTFPYGWENGNT